jgi:hypothetical protein
MARCPPALWLSTTGAEANTVTNAVGRLAAGILVLFVGGMLAGCGGGASSDELAQARQEGAAAEREKQAQQAERQKQAQLEARIKKLEKKLAKSKTVGKPAGKTATTRPRTSPTTTSCGGSLSVGSNTTCPFAENVRSAWYSAGGGSVVVSAYSPVTGRYYTMTCVAGVPTICRGGNNAVVYIR